VKNEAKACPFCRRPAKTKIEFGEVYALCSSVDDPWANCAGAMLYQGVPIEVWNDRKPTSAPRRKRAARPAIERGATMPGSRSPQVSPRKGDVLGDSSDAGDVFWTVEDVVGRIVKVRNSVTDRVNELSLGHWRERSRSWVVIETGKAVKT
jgi:hypothetical protein